MKLLISFLSGSLLLVSSFSYAQSKFKLGVGMNLFSNQADMQYLESYFAPSLHFSYRIVSKSSFSLALENATSLRAKQSGDITEIGFASSLPLTVQYDWKKVGVYVGAGPAYLTQSYKSYIHKESASGTYINYTTGVALKGKPILSGILYPEYNIRFSYYRRLKEVNNDVAAISLIIFLRGT